MSDREVLKKLYFVLKNQQTMIKKLAGKVSLGENYPSIAVDVQRDLESFVVRVLGGQKFKYGVDGKLGPETRGAIDKAKKFLGIPNATDEELFSRVKKYLFEEFLGVDPLKGHYNRLIEVIKQLVDSKSQIKDAEGLKFINGEIARLKNLLKSYKNLPLEQKPEKEADFSVNIANAKKRATDIIAKYMVSSNVEGKFAQLKDKLPTIIRNLSVLKQDPKVQGDANKMNKVDAYLGGLGMVNNLVSQNETFVKRHFDRYDKYVNKIESEISAMKA